MHLELFLLWMCLLILCFFIQHSPKPTCKRWGSIRFSLLNQTLQILKTDPLATSETPQEGGIPAAAEELAITSVLNNGCKAIGKGTHSIDANRWLCQELCPRATCMPLHRPGAGEAVQGFARVILQAYSWACQSCAGSPARCTYGVVSGNFPGVWMRPRSCQPLHPQRGCIPPCPVMYAYFCAHLSSIICPPGGRRNN